jgi:hypothetical protein
MEIKSKISQTYAQYVLDQNERPSSVYSFAKKLKIEEGVFYQHYSSFDAIEQGFLQDLLEQTIEQLKADEIYLGYSGREKMLAFYFALFQRMANNRSFIQFISKSNQSKLPLQMPSVFQGFKNTFIAYAKDVLEHGYSGSEIENRKFISDRYPEILWMQTLFLFQFWLKDTSLGFEQTDAAVEKTVNLAFDMMAKSAIDSAFDWFKFLWQHKGVSI